MLCGTCTLIGVLLLLPPFPRATPEEIALRQHEELRELQQARKAEEEEDLRRAECLRGTLKVRESWGRSIHTRTLYDADGKGLSCKK